LEGVWEEAVVLYRRNVMAFFWRDWGKPRKLLVRITTVPADIGASVPQIQGYDNMTVGRLVNTVIYVRVLQKA
jgi:hypothetical protein